MDESTIDALQKKIDQLNGLIEAAEKTAKRSEMGISEEVARLERSLAPELGASYREIVKALLREGRKDETFYPLHKSTSWFERIDAFDELEENSLILARMQEMDGHYDWAESTMRVALWYAKYCEGD